MTESIKDQHIQLGKLALEPSPFILVSRLQQQEGLFSFLQFSCVATQNCRVYSGPPGNSNNSAGSDVATQKNEVCA